MRSMTRPHHGHAASWDCEERRSQRPAAVDSNPGRSWNRGDNSTSTGIGSNAAQTLAKQRTRRNRDWHQKRPLHR
jgi:hypothetical protein